jgi:hypothetical protein
LSAKSGDFEPLQLDAVAVHVREVVLRLLSQPAFLGAAEYLFLETSTGARAAGKHGNGSQQAIAGSRGVTP